MSLRKSAFSAGRWTAASLLTRALLQIAQTVVLARLLAPGDFGLMAIIGAIYAVVYLFVDFGLSNALIHFPQPSPAVLSTLYWLNIGAAVLMMLIFAALAWPLALVYQQASLTSAMLIMSLALPLAALGQQFRVIAEKELRFATLGIIEVAAAVCGFLAALVVAFLGGGVYSLIAGILVTAGTSSALAWMFLSKGLRPSFQLELPAVVPFLRYGSYRLGDTLCNSIQTQMDVLIGGAVVGAAAMGVYTLPREQALRLANTVINPIVTRVGLPVMAKVQGDRAALKSLYLRTLRMTSSVNFPIYTALALWADEIVAVLLGDQWRDAGHFMRVFAVWGLIRSTGNPVGSLLYATGQVRRAFWWNLGQLIFVSGLLWLAAARYGIEGLALAMLLVQVLIFYPLFRVLVQAVCGVRFQEYIGEMFPALATTAVAAGCGLLVTSILPLEPLTVLVFGGFTLAVTYVGVSFLFNKPWIDAAVELIGPLFRRLQAR